MPKAHDEQTKAVIAALGASLRRARLRRRWTQEEVAFELGLDPANYSRIESGKTNITIGQFVAICRVFGWPVPKVLR